MCYYVLSLLLHKINFEMMQSVFFFCKCAVAYFIIYYGQIVLGLAYLVISKSVA